jgi:hypothetical protein
MFWLLQRGVKANKWGLLQYNKEARSKSKVISIKWNATEINKYLYTPQTLCKFIGSYCKQSKNNELFDYVVIGVQSKGCVHPWEQRCNERCSYLRKEKQEKLETFKSIGSLIIWKFRQILFGQNGIIGTRNTKMGNERCVQNLRY